jgi:uncharacterized repeat protein (TIGR01451 family)
MNLVSFARGKSARSKFAIFTLAFAAIGAPSRLAAQVEVDTTTQGVTYGSHCSFQEAIYAAEFGASVAVDATSPDHTYATACSPTSGDWSTIVLQNTTYSFSQPWSGDAHNPFGPTATPIIFKKITVQGNGATLQWTGSGYSRLFAVGEASIPAISTDVATSAVSGTGNLTLQNVYVKNFHVKGGDGAAGGAGGLGAGGAIYVGKVSTGVPALTVINSTFENNGATGGNGAFSVTCCTGGGGGGGLGGNGSKGSAAGGGGGGARGNGGNALSGSGAGGGGTVFDGGDAFLDQHDHTVGGSGGYLCGGGGGSFQVNSATDGGNATCPGGGGGGSSSNNNVDPYVAVFGGDGAYGGGGGGGEAAVTNANGGNGGFGGGGGYASGCIGQCSGDGGFGGGGGGHDGHGGPFGGNGGNDAFGDTGGGGGALGGAIFNDNGTVTVQNTTFYNNAVLRGLGGGGSAGNGGDSGAAIFSRNGSLIVQNSTISGGAASGAGGGIVVYADGFPATPIFVLDNTIIANNGSQECIVHGIALTSSGGTNSAHNLIVNNLGCPQATISADPKLDSLKLNAPGNTPTMALLSGSPAIGAADTNTSLSTDQRGVQRKAVPDIGAYEAVPHADLNLTMKVSPDTAKAGDTVTYTLSFGNTGPDNASGVTITENFPSELTYTTCLANAGGSCNSSGASYSSLLANETQVVTISGTLKSGLTRGTVVSNTASIQASSPVDFKTSNNSDSASFTVIVPDFSLSAVSPITIPVGSSGTSSLTVGSIDTFSSAVSLTATSPSNFHKSFSPNPVTPPSNGSSISTLTVTLEPSVAVGTYTMNETGTSGALSHTASVTVNVQTTIAGTKNVINSDLKLGAIDSAGIATALNAKLAVAQSATDAAQTQTGINTLQALLSQLNAQSGKHIKTYWLDGNGQPFNPAAVLIGDVTDLLVNAGANLKATPIIGNVVNASGVGVSGLTVNVLNSKNVSAASATTDVTGFYYFPATSGLTTEANYTVKVTVPKSYRNSSPSSQNFTWKSAAVSLDNFVLN